MKQAHRQLPQTPRKKKAVLGKLVEDVGLPTSEEQARKKNRTSEGNEELDKKVTDFENSDVITWQAPGQKDKIIYCSRKEYGKKEKEYMYSPGICYCFGWKPMNLLSKRE